MEDVCTYQIEIQGQVDVHDLNTISPLKMELTRVDQNGTHLKIYTDQSGLIGLMRYLHGMGLIFSSLQRDRRPYDESI